MVTISVNARIGSATGYSTTKMFVDCDEVYFVRRACARNLSWSMDSNDYPTAAETKTQDVRNMVAKRLNGAVVEDRCERKKLQHSITLSYKPIVLCCGLEKRPRYACSNRRKWKRNCVLLLIANLPKSSASEVTLRTPKEQSAADVVMELPST